MHGAQDDYRVILLYVSFGSSGEVRGGPRSLLVMARHLSRYRPMFVVNRETALRGELAEHGIRVEVIEAPRFLDGFRAASWKEKTARLRSILRHGRAVVGTARRHGARIVHCQDESEVVTVGVVARVCRLGVILQVRDAPRHSRLRLVHLFASAVASRIIFNSEPLRAQYVAAAPKVLRGWLRRRSVAILSGLDLETVDVGRQWTPPAARATLGLPSESFVLTVVGPLTPKKNQLCLIETLADDLLRLGPDVFLLFVGNDRQDPRYAERCREAIAGLDRKERVRVLGTLPHARMWEVYAATDVLLVPSVREGLPRTILESQAVGVPVVASDIAGNAGGIMDGETGYLVSLSDAAGFITAVARLREPLARQEMGQRAVRHARETFDPRRSASMVEHVYDVIGGQTRRA